MSAAVARAVLSTIRTFISGAAVIVITIVMAVCLGFYAKLLWRAVRFGWDLIQ